MDVSVPSVWSISGPLQRIDWYHVECSGCVCACVIESLLISYGCLLLRSIAVSLHKVVLTACAIWNPSIHHPASIHPSHMGTKQPTLINKSVAFLLEGQLKFSLSAPPKCVFHYSTIVLAFVARSGLIWPEVYPNKLKCVERPCSPLLSFDFTTSDHSLIPDCIKTRLSTPSSLCSPLLPG